MRDKFILDGHTPVQCDCLTTWRQFISDEKNRRVAFDKVDNCDISTVFLGLNHRFGEGRPLLFETMIFGREHDEFQERYSTWAEAEAGHARAIARAKGGA